MSHQYDFDRVIDRHGTGALKTDALVETFGRPDLTALWIADMDFAVAPEISQTLALRFSHPIFGYSGAPDSYWNSIIDWLDHRHGFKVTREELTFIPGVVKGIGYAVNFFTDKGDGVLIQPPVYHPFKMVIEGNDRRLVTNPLRLEADGKTYSMDFDDLEAKMRDEHPRMMILCNPHNPAGVQWSAETLREVARLARKYDVKVVSDEIHGDLMLWGNSHVPFVSVSDDAAAVGIMLGAPSKTFNIPGLVSSWMVVKNPELRRDFYRWLEANEFDVPTLTATIATETAYRQCERWLDDALSYIEENIKAAEAFVADRMPMMRCMRPDASFLIWLDCRTLDLEQRNLVDMMVNEARLALNDGEMFGKEGRGFMRLNVATPRAVLLAALDKLARAVAHHVPAMAEA